MHRVCECVCVCVEGGGGLSERGGYFIAREKGVSLCTLAFLFSYDGAPFGQRAVHDAQELSLQSFLLCANKKVFLSEQTKQDKKLLAACLTKEWGV